MMPAYVIRTRHLSREFDRRAVVDDVTLDVTQGKVFGLLGPVDSGKTTLMRLLMGLLEPTSGSAQVLGYDSVRGGAAIRAATGALLYGDELHNRLTARNNLELHGRISGRPKTDWQPRIRHLMQHFDLWDRRQEIVGDWDVAARRRLGLARALLNRPPLLFLDEPTAGLDPVSAAALRDDLGRIITAEGLSVWLNTASLDDAGQLCQQVGVIQNGQLLQVGSPDVLHQSPSARFRITGRNFNAGVLAVLRAYPHVRSVQRGSGESGDYLLLEINQRRDPAPFVSAIVNAGGEITEVRRVQSSVEAVLRQLDHEGPNGECV